MSVLGLLIITATLQETVRQYLLGRPIDAKTDALAVRVIHCFSVLSNGRKLLSTKSSAESFSCLHGIRVLSTTWVIMAHTYLIAAQFLPYNLYMVIQVYTV